MIPATYPSTLITGGGRAINVQMIYSITGLVRWVDYIPVKFVGTATDNYAEAGGLSAINQSTGSNWTDFIKCYEDTSATKAWKCEADGYIPLYQYDGFYSFYAPLVSSLVLSKGTGTPTFTRADATSCATHTDFEGIVRVVPANAARFQGCRVVRNLLTFTEDFSNAGWAVFNAGVGSLPTKTPNFGVAPNGATTACRLQLAMNGGTTGTDVSYLQASGTTGVITDTAVQSYWVKSNTASTYVVGVIGGASVGNLMTVTPTWQRVSTSRAGNNPFQIGLRGSMAASGQSDSVDLLIWHPQYEITTGQTNQNPSEYVPVGVLSYPYSGSGVDGLLFSPNLNGNTVSSSVVTAGTGAAIKQGTAGVSATAPVDASGPQGYLSEVSRTNLCLQSEDFATTWTPSVNATISVNSVISPNGTLTADSLNEDATASVSHSVQQTFVKAASALAYSFSVFVKPAGRNWVCITAWDYVSVGNRYWFNVSTGIVGSTAAIGAGFTAVSANIYPAGNGWYRCVLNVTSSTVAAITPVIYSCNADAVFTPPTGLNAVGLYLWGAQLEQAAFASTYIPTVASAVTRNADVLTYPSAGNISDTGSVYAEATHTWSAAIPNGSFIVSSRSTTGGVPLYINSTQNIALYDTTAVRTGVSVSTLATVQKFASSFGGSTGVLALNGSTTAIVYDGTMNVEANIGIGTDLAATPASPYNGTIRNVRIWPTALTSTQLQAITT